MIISNYFTHKNFIQIGRKADANIDIVINNSLVSRLHCSIEKINDNEFILTDQSKNGIFVNGTFVNNRSIAITGFEQIIIGGNVIYIYEPKSNETALRIENIEKIFTNGFVGLHSCSFSIKKGEFIALLGPSGCGKSTLLKAINGDNPATMGVVEIFGIDLYKNFNQLRKLIAYVPQDDIAHSALSAKKALQYALALRLPDITNFDEQEKLINKCLQAVNMLDADLIQKPIQTLSGGQRKRICIAIELLTEPSILFLDEPTSPLDPETIEDFLHCLQTLAKQGTTIIMVTHKPDDIAFVDKVLWMGKGGYITYFGDKNQYLQYFGVKRPTEIYTKINTPENALFWNNKYQLALQHSTVANLQKQNLIKNQSNYLQQTKVLFLRQCSLFIADKNASLFVMLQSPIIAILLAILFYKNLTHICLFMLCIASIWFGISNAATLIVGERAIYMRERAFNLNIASYLCAKIAFLLAIGVLQSLLFVLIIAFCVGNTYYLQHVFKVFLCLVNINLTASVAGLALSAMVNSKEKAIAIQPLMVIPQILFAGVIYPLQNTNFLVEIISLCSFARWGTQAIAENQQVATIANTNNALQILNLPDTLRLWQSFKPVFGSYFIFNNVVLFCATLLLYALLYALMRRKDVLL